MGQVREEDRDEPTRPGSRRAKPPSTPGEATMQGTFRTPSLPRHISDVGSVPRVGDCTGRLMTGPQSIGPGRRTGVAFAVLQLVVLAWICSCVEESLLKRRKTMSKLQFRPHPATALALAVAVLAAGVPSAIARPASDSFLESAIRLDRVTGDITLPLYQGRHDGDTVWYIITESSDQKQAKRLGVNFAPKLANALGTAAVQDARLVNALTGKPVAAASNPVAAASSLMSRGVVLDFDGTVDFSPVRMVVPDPDNGFPPLSFRAGAVGDAEYSPLITLGDGIVLNASQVANSSGLHDALVHIDRQAREVTLDQFNGFYEFDAILYLHQEGSIELVAAVEGSTWAPNLNAAPGLGSNDPDSARSAIIPIVNGERGVSNPDRQGLESALLGEGDPLNITQEEPGFEDGEVPYSPVWDLHLVVWTDAAIASGDRHRLTDADEVADAFVDGLVVSGAPDGMPNDSLGGLRAIGAISNCPVTFNLGPA